MPSKAIGDLLSLIPAFLIAVAATCAADYLLLNHDVAFFLNCADRLLHGARLYKDILDNNVPMIMFLSIIPVAIHMITGWPLPELFFLCAFVLLWGSFHFTWHILRKHPAFAHAGINAVSFALLAYAIFFLPNFTRDFGQREQLFCLLVLPYVALAINAFSAIQNSDRQKIIAGILAAIGLCLKPHFMLMFFVVEGFYFYETRSLHFYRRLETLVIVLIVAFYYLTMLLYARDYFFEYAPHVLYTMHAYASPFVPILITGLMPAFIAACCMFLAPKRSSYRNGMYLIFMLVAASAILFVVQKTNYEYHLIPEIFFIILLLIFIASISTSRIIMLASLALAAGFLFFISGGTDMQTSVDNALRPKKTILALSEAIKPYDSVIIFGGSVLPGFPAVIYAGTQWGLHNACVCYVLSDYESQRESAAVIYHPPSEMAPGLRYFQDLVMEDMAKLPAAIVVNETPAQQAMPPHFDFVAHFMKDPRFLPLWAHYQATRMIINGPERFAIYKRVD